MVDFFIVVSTLCWAAAPPWFSTGRFNRPDVLVFDRARPESLMQTIARIEPLSEAGALPTWACNGMKGLRSSNFSLYERMTP
jgi:hypothetical protein